MNSAIAVVLELQDRKISRHSWETLEGARQLGALLDQSVDVIALGSDFSGIGAELSGKSVRRVLHAPADSLRTYSPDGYCAALGQLLDNPDFSHVLFPHTYQVREFAPKLAAQLDRPLLTDCIGMRREGSDLVFSRQLFQGKLVADVCFEGPGPFFVSVQAGTFPPAADALGDGVPEIQVVDLTFAPGTIRTVPQERLQETKRTVDLSQSDVIVAIGRGIKEAEHLPLVEKLAQAMGAQIAGSRPICDSGWLPMERQVGSSGQTVAPKLYVAIGISGAIQHLVGMKGSRKIVAINKDAHAPIFEVADIGIVANLFDVVPAITEQVLKIRQT